MKKIIGVLLIFSMISACIVNAETKNCVEIYVDCKVEESGDGSFEKPFATIEEAQQFIRNMNENGNYPQNGVTVFIRQGNYKIDKTVNFTEKDSGTDSAPVIYRAYPLETVNFVGGSELTLGEFKVSDDSRIPEEVKGKIYSYNLKDNGITPYDKLYCTGHSQYYMQLVLTEDIDTEAKTRATPEVFYNDQLTTIARWPNDGYTTIGDVVNPGTEIKALSDKKETAKLEDVEPMSFNVSVEPERLEKWKSESDAWLFGYWKYDWSDMTTPVKEIDSKSGVITTKYPSPYLPQKGQRFYLYNALCELDAPGEWYLDKNSGEFFIYPLDNDNSSKIILGFSSSTLFFFDKASNITLKDLNFAGSRSNGITISEGENVTVFGCNIKNISGSGISVTGDNHRVDSCHIYNIGGRGISLSGGDQTTLEAGNSIAQNNWIHNFGRLNKTYYGGITIQGVGNTARHNLIYDGPHLGIQYGGNDNIIEYNDVSNVLKEAADMGAIYGGNSYVNGRGVVFRGNVVHDLVTDSVHSGQYGIYVDDTMSGITAEQNLFYNLPSGIFINGGRECTVINNTFVNLKTGVQIYCTGLAKSWGYYSTPDALAKVGVGEGQKSTSEPYSKYPHLSTMHLEDNPRAPKNNVIKDNINCGVDKAVNLNPLTETGSGATEADMRKWSEISDGLSVGKDAFVDAEKTNFNLKVPVTDKLPDFETVDFNKAGLITSRLKNSLSEDAIVLAIDKPLSYVNWKKKLIDEENIKIVPQIKENRTYIPVRFMAEMLGASVEFNDGVIGIEYNGKKLELTNGSNIAKIDGEESELDGACFIENSRTYVPLRSCSNLFQKEVFWDDYGLIVISDRDMTEILDSDMIKNLYDRL